MTVGLMLLSLLAAACSSGNDEDAVKGMKASEVRSGFAKEATSETALTAVTGNDRFTSELSTPKRALEALREAAFVDQSGKSGKPRMQGIPYCWLLSAEDGKAALRITLREELAVPARDARFGDSVTYFSSGARAYASDSLALVFFECRMKAPAHRFPGLPYASE
jgi:hypothetical protein